MSLNPFTADPAIRARIEALTASIGSAVVADIAAAAIDTVVGPETVAALIARYELTGPEELMLLALPAARTYAQPPISGFFVGCVGLERETGGLILGGNLEFPGGHLGYTVHGEGFVFTRAFHRGTTLAAIATGEAHPCAHCRQFISEFASSRDLVLIDLLGHRLTMQQLYPWPFDPAYLGETGAVAGAVNWPGLTFTGQPPPSTVAERLLNLGKTAWAPYSRCPGAIVLTLGDGTLVGGCGIESVAFNPGMTPLQAALIELLARGRAFSDIAAATLGTVVGGNADYSTATADLLAAVAPGAPITVDGWSPTHR